MGRIEARKLDHIFGEIDGVLGSANVDEALDQPIIVVSVVVDLFGQSVGGDHRGVIDACGSLLLPGGIGIAVELAKGVTGHVPEVGDPWGGLSAARCGDQRVLVVI